MEKKSAHKKQDGTSSPPSSAPVRGRKLWLFRAGAVVLVPALFFVLLEVALRLAGYGYDAHFFKRLDIGGEPFLVQNEDFSRRFFPAETMRQPNALRMRAQKKPGSIRVFVIGESAAMGDPEPAFGPARYMEALLEDRFAGREFEVVNVAFTAINSHVLLPLAAECAEHEGDIWIVYMGNNEMVGPYGAATVLGSQSLPRPLIRLVTKIQTTRTGQLVMEWVRGSQKSGAESGSWGGMAMFQHQRVPPQSDKREAVYQNFAANLDAMLDCGLESGASVILNTVAVNLKDSPPFASVSAATLSESNQSRFKELFSQGVVMQNARDASNAAAAFTSALGLDHTHAEARYRLATCLEATGDVAGASRAYQLACDTDALPFRTDARENGLIREAAKHHAEDRLMLVDAAAEMADGLRAGVCGEEFFYEHVHFNFNGSYRLGSLWAKAVEARLPQPWRTAVTNDWLSQPSCEQRLGLTDLNRRLVTLSMMQRFKAPPLNLQFNNAERLRRLGVYEQFIASTLNVGTIRAAQENFPPLLAKHPEDHHLIEQHAVFAQSLGDFETALRDWRRVAELLPHDFLPSLQIGSILSKQGKFAEAEPHFRRALLIRPVLVEAWNELGQCLGAQQKWQPALEAFDQAVRLKPDESLFRAFRAKVCSGMGRREEAIENYRKAVELNPDYAEAHAALGDEYAHVGKISEALSCYEAAVRARPGYAVAHFNMGVMLLRQGRLDDAAAQFRQTLALEPQHAAAREFLVETIGRINAARPR